MYKTYQFRIKDSSAKKKLTDLASKVNLVWNYCNSISNLAWRRSRKWLSAYDIGPLLAGGSKELGLFASIIQCVACEHAKKRNQLNRSKLKWRSNKKSLPWIPMDTRCFSLRGDIIKFNKLSLKIWKSRDVEGRICTASVCSDSRGHWFVNIVVVVLEDDDVVRICTGKDVGVDLGLKSLATCSDGTVFTHPKPFKQLKDKLARAQRAKKKKLVNKIHNKIANIREDFNHKVSTKLVKENDVVFVGNVPIKGIIRNRKFSKSAIDVAWGQFRSMLGYKAIRQGVLYKEVNEAWSSVTCSGCLKRSGPSGLSNLGVRYWTCISCNMNHQRDINAATNILRIGYGSIPLIDEETHNG